MRVFIIFHFKNCYNSSCMARQSSLNCSLLSARKSEPGDKEQKTGKEHLVYMSLRE